MFTVAVFYPSLQKKSGCLHLDMAAESVDDMFDGCRTEAASVIDLFGVFEWHYNTNFSLAWASAERLAKKPVHKHLKDDHSVVLYIFTRAKHLRQHFNEAVKTGKHKYNSRGFKFHYFYFYLTEAIQVLHRNASCRVAYYRTQEQFSHDGINKNMRFGTFTWAASAKQTFSVNGNVSCFEIYTCFSADITYYSATSQPGQLLIPQYEVFRIADVLTNDPWCSAVYKLQSTRIPRRDLNCKLSPKPIKRYLEAVSTQWIESSFRKMLTCVTLLVIISFVLVKQRQTWFVAVVLGSLLVLLIVAVLVNRTAVMVSL